MRTPLTAGVVLLLALAGCDRPRPAAAAGDAAAEEALPDTPAPPVTVRASFQCPRPAIEGEPALPLDAPLSALQRLICAQPDLALLDRRVHEAYLATRLRSGVDRGNLSKRQTQWQADRDTCLKAADPSACVDEALRTRLVELALQDPQTVAGTRVAFVCEGTGTPLTAAFYSRFDPPFAVLGFGKQQAVVFLRPTNAGLKYERSGANLFVHQGRVEAELYGRTLACVLPSSPWLRAPAPAVAAAAGAGTERTEAAPVAGAVRAEAAPAGGAAAVQARPATGAASFQATPAIGAAPIPAAPVAGAALAKATPGAGTASAKAAPATGMASAEAAPVVPTPAAASARPAPARPPAPALTAPTVPVVTPAAVAAPASAVATVQGLRAAPPQLIAPRPSTPASTSTSTPRPAATKPPTTAIATAAPSGPAPKSVPAAAGAASAPAPVRVPPTRPISGQPQAPLLALASRPAAGRLVLRTRVVATSFSRFACRGHGADRHFTNHAAPRRCASVSPSIGTPNDTRPERSPDGARTTPGGAHLCITINSITVSIRAIRAIRSEGAGGRNARSQCRCIAEACAPAACRRTDCLGRLADGRPCGWRNCRADGTPQTVQGSYQRCGGCGYGRVDPAGAGRSAGRARPKPRAPGLHLPLCRVRPRCRLPRRRRRPCRPSLEAADSAGVVVRKPGKRKAKAPHPGPPLRLRRKGGGKAPAGQTGRRLVAGFAARRCGWPSSCSRCSCWALTAQRSSIARSAAELEVAAND
ncbi:hypothetical protein [Pseudoxanthomonas sp. SORGH_AS_0997]|uniref:hypothetical protein n=1 Tax=Pseudoxanthomonas sp. SORGH_AS_0997 TaxID=3041776 RepID=UPI00286381A6|nr:hypothetical protein [Pseudoxanthomonas sp. SORGH_AS_0997]MDR6140008.1 uncharacterized protein [Pseudoxanthomonas sp. SORGH_AS_0997]